MTTIAVSACAGQSPAVGPIRAGGDGAPPPTTVRDLVPDVVPAGRIPIRLARALLAPMLAGLRGGRLAIREGGREQVYGDGRSRVVGVTVHNPNLWGAVIARRGVGLAEGYIHGWWESDDLVGVLSLLARNLNRVGVPRNLLARWRNAVVAPLDRRQSRGKRDDRAYVGAHYDLGDDFFELFLDPTLAYSCGIFADSDTTLEEASVAKFDRICASLELAPGDHLLEIGTGWGGFAIHAATRYGCHVTTTTISERQYQRACHRVAEAGLEDRVTVLNRDYRDLDGRYSRLVSIEMIEAVDWRDHDEFFATCDRLLAPGGRAVLQCIVIGDQDYERTKNSQDFIKRFIFPGGCLPSLQAIHSSLARVSDLRVALVDDIGPHYARTLREWRRRLDRRWDEARATGHDERFLRMWRYYFAYCEAGFAERHVSVVQMVLDRKS